MKITCVFADSANMQIRLTSTSPLLVLHLQKKITIHILDT